MQQLAHSFLPWLQLNARGRVARYLEAIEPRELVWQLAPLVLESVVRVLQDRSSAYIDKHTSAEVNKAIASVVKLCGSLGWDFDRDRDKLEQACIEISRVEAALSETESLVYKLGQMAPVGTANEHEPPSDQPDDIARQAPSPESAGAADEDEGRIHQTVASKLVGGYEYLVLQDFEKSLFRRFFCHELNVDRLSDAEPEVREVLFRMVSQRPTSESRQGAHRLYCSLSDDHFRLSGAISVDDLFT